MKVTIITEVKYSLKGLNNRFKMTDDRISELEDGSVETIQSVEHRGKRQIKMSRGTSLVVHCVGLCVPNAGGPGFIPGQGTRSHLHATTKKSACHN